MARVCWSRLGSGRGRRPVTLTAALLLGLALTSCGWGDGDLPIDPGSTSPQPGAGDVVKDDVHNAQDAAFAHDMVLRHRQAIELSGLVKDHTSNPALLVLAQQISNEQTPELDEMISWLEEWHQPVTTPSATVVDGTAGMASAVDLATLRTDQGPAFDRLYLTLMIANQLGGVAEARDEQRTGADERARGLAEDMASAQSEKITAMRRLLG